VEPVEITAGRLHLRPFGPADEDAVYAACQDPEIQRWTRVPSPYSLADARQFVTLQAPAGWRDDREYTFAVVDATSATLLASVSVRGPTADRTGEIGYWVAAAARGQGVATQAVAAVCRWGFATVGYARIDWYAAVGNDGSRRVAEKVGFTVEGVMRSRLELGGVRHDAWVGGLLPV
jgi:RimJ/RimL family protein N-acetyltransferase